MNDEFSDEDRRAILARRQRFIALAIGGLSTGCVPSQPGAEGGTTTVGSSTGTSSAGDTESGTSGTTETETETDTEGELDTGPPGSTFVPETMPRPCLSECDPFAQDCPEGEKCVPQSSTGQNWDANACVPVLGEQADGEPCTYGGISEATDDCDVSSYCWQAQDVEGTLTGVCTSFCTGTSDDAICPEGRACLIANEGSISLCVPECDPLVSQCGEDLGCSWIGGAFACILTTQETPLGDACGFVNDCAADSLCAAGEALPACESAACCTDYCAVDDPESCPDPQLECASFFGEGEAPEGLDTLGICVAPAACDDEEPGCIEHAIAEHIDN